MQCSRPACAWCGTIVEHHHNLLQAAVAGTDFYEDYTGIKLPLPKLDMVAIPGKRGAVEHWGLLQFDEERMLVNKVWSK